MRDTGRMGMNTSHSANECVPMLVDEREAGKLLGVSSRTIFTFRQRGLIPHVKIGARILYPVAGLHRFIEANTEGVAAK